MEAYAEPRVHTNAVENVGHKGDGSGLSSECPTRGESLSRRDHEACNIHMQAAGERRDTGGKAAHFSRGKGRARRKGMEEPSEGPYRYEGVILRMAEQTLTGGLRTTLRPRL